MLTNLNKYQGTTTDEPKFRLYDLERGVEADKGRLYTAEEMQDMLFKRFEAGLDSDLAKDFIKETGTFIAPGAPESMYMSGSQGQLPRFEFMPDGDDYQKYFNGMISMIAAGFDPATVKEQFGAGNFNKVIEKINNQELKVGLGPSFELDGIGNTLVNLLVAPSELTPDEVSAQMDMKKLGVTPASISPYAAEIERRISRGESFEDLVKSKAIKPELADVFSDLYNKSYPALGGSFDLSKIARPRYLDRMEQEQMGYGLYQSEANLNRLRNPELIFSGATLPPYSSNLTPEGLPIGRGTKDFTAQEIAALKEGNSIAGDNSTVFTNKDGAPVLVEAENKDIERAVNYALRSAPQATFADQSTPTTQPFNAESVIGLAASYLPEEAFYTLPDGARGNLKPEYQEQLGEVLTTVSKADIGISKNQFRDAMETYNVAVGDVYDATQQDIFDSHFQNKRIHGQPKTMGGNFDVKYLGDFDLGPAPLNLLTGQPYANVDELPASIGNRGPLDYLLMGFENYKPPALSSYTVNPNVARFLPNFVVNEMNDPNRFLTGKAIARGYDLYKRDSPLAFQLNEDYIKQRPILSNLGRGTLLATSVLPDLGTRLVSKGVELLDNRFDFLSDDYKKQLQGISDRPFLGITYKNFENPNKPGDYSPGMYKAQDEAMLFNPYYKNLEPFRQVGIEPKDDITYNRLDRNNKYIPLGDVQAGLPVYPTDALLTNRFQETLQDISPALRMGVNLGLNALFLNPRGTFATAQGLGRTALKPFKTGTQYKLNPQGNVIGTPQYRLSELGQKIRGRGTTSFSFEGPGGAVFGENVIRQGFGKNPVFVSQYGTKAPVATNILSQNIGSKPGFTPGVTFTGTLGRQGLNPTGLYKGQAFNQNMRFNTGYRDLLRGETFKPSISSKLPQGTP